MNLGVKGTTVGTPWDAQWNPGVNYVYGQEPDPTTPKKTTDNYTTHYDYCSSDQTQLNEGECNADGKVAAYGHSCPYGCADGACKAAPPSDAPPSITLSVTATSPQTWRPGGRGYYTTAISDDRGLKTVVVTTSPMMYSGSPIDMSSKCAGKISCEEKVYTIVPSNPGSQFVTVMATDSAGQVSTKTVNFDAPACTVSTDCGSSDIQWAGASYCGSPDDTSDTSIMQYGVAATCKAGGVCDTSSLPRVKQQCSAGQMCTFDTNGNNLCIAQPLACTVGAQITSVCVCGKSAYNYPGDWRVRSPTYCCTWNDGSFYTTSPGPCLTVQVSSPVSSAVSHQVATGSTTSPTQTVGGMSGTPVTVPPPGSPVVPVMAPAMAHPSAPKEVTKTAVTAPKTVTKDQVKDGAKEGKRLSAAEVRHETQLLKSRGKQTSAKIKSIERNIASLEKKIDAKLRLLDRVKKEEVQKRASAQIDGWQKKIDGLEAQKEKLEILMDDLRESFEQWKAAAE
ncbi:hypothetical protein HYW11_02075 [Candidatus Peregrinibacteria bacterium]|nr:hypothetical protein [Candidatus Peregrinibacteria bacterium]